MAELDLLTEIHTDVRYIKSTLDSHLKKDEQIAQEYIKPLWEAHQQGIGEVRAQGTRSVITQFLINSGIALVTAWAAVKGLSNK